VTQEKYRDLIRLCREEIRKTEAQLELRLATIVRDIKKCFYKYTNNKKDLRIVSIPYWMWGGEHCQQG